METSGPPTTKSPPPASDSVTLTGWHSLQLLRHLRGGGNVAGVSYFSHDFVESVAERRGLHVADLDPRHHLSQQPY